MTVMDYHAILLQLGITPNYKGFHQMLTTLRSFRPIQRR